MSGAPAAVHFLIASFGTAGDIFPMLAIGRGLLARGHRVTLLAAQPFEQAALAAGLAFEAVLTQAECDRVLADPDLWHARRGFAAAWKGQLAASTRVLEALARLPRDQRHVLLVHPLALPAADVARALHPGLRVVGAYLAPSNMRTCHDPMMLGPTAIPAWMPMALRRWMWRRVEASMIDPHALPGLNAMRAGAGLAPVPHFMAHIESVADASLALFPEWFGPRQPDWPAPLQHTGFMLYDQQPGAALPPALEHFLANGTAPIVFTPGSGYTHGRQYFDSALRAVQGLGRRAIFLTMHRDQVPAALPACAMWQDFLPLRPLLPRIAALVYHGGVGTMAEALLAGVPQLVVPCAHDQFDNARRVTALGVGRQLPMGDVRADTLERMLGAVLASEALAATCRTVASRLAGAAGVDLACDLMEAQAGITAGEGAA